MLESRETDSARLMNIEDEENQEDRPRQKSSFEIEGTYWWSKVNWTSFGLHQVHRTVKAAPKQQGSHELSRQTSRY
jgi:hypothetical protein